MHSAIGMQSALQPLKTGFFPGTQSTLTTLHAVPTQQLPTPVKHANGEALGAEVGEAAGARDGEGEGTAIGFCCTQPSINTAIATKAIK